MHGAQGGDRRAGRAHGGGQTAHLPRDALAPVAGVGQDRFGQTGGVEQAEPPLGHFGAEVPAFHPVIRCRKDPGTEPSLSQPQTRDGRPHLSQFVRRAGRLRLVHV